jgi:hypothetical protein
LQANYQTIFEIGFRSLPWTRLMHPLVFVAIGLLLVRFHKSKIYRVMGVFVALLASFFFFIWLVVFIPQFVALRSAYVSGKSSIVEGTVENFHPAPALGPARESFSVHGVIFSYNALEDTPCFHSAPYHFGPIRAGLDVRIHYDEECIQRVEIRTGAA